MSVEYLQLSDDVWNPDSDHSAGDNHQRRRDEQHGYKGRGGGLSGIPGHRTYRSTKNMDDRCVHIERLHSFEINQQIEESMLSTSYIYSSYEVLSVCYTLDENNNPALIYRVGLKTKARPGQEPEISEMISLIVRDTNPF